jgi:D-Tyr-tRNAtyr deacylase
MSMILGSRKAFAAVAAAAVLVGSAGAGAASAGKGHGHRSLLKAAAQYIGVGKADLVKDALAGKTLAQIATGHGKTVDGLKAAMLAAVKTRLDAAVAVGKATTAQEQTKLDRAAKLIDRIVNAKIGKVTRRAGKAKLLNVAARYLGVSPKALTADLKAGKSLAQVATAHGKTAAGLKDALLEAFKAHLDKAMAANRITAAQAQERIAKISARLDKLISRTK